MSDQPKKTLTIWVEGKEITIKVKCPLPNDLKADLLSGREVQEWFRRRGGPLSDWLEEAIAKAAKVLKQGIEPYLCCWIGGGPMRLALLFIIL